MWAFYRDAFGHWRWERMGETSPGLESHDGFETRAKCLQDAAEHGYLEDEEAPELSDRREPP